MKTNLEIITSLALLIGYSYTLSAAHVILAKIDKLTAVPRQITGEIRLSALPELCLAYPIARKAVTLLRINNYIVYVFFALLIWSLFFEGTSSLADIHALTKNIHP
jgi:hypothetical protein